MDYFAFLSYFGGCFLLFFDLLDFVDTLDCFFYIFF